MLEIAIAFYCVYFLINVYTVFMQIDYVKKARLQSAVILTPSKFKVAGDYGVESQKLSLLSIFYEFILFFVWISIGLVALDDATSSFVGWQKAVVFIDAFIIINWLFGLPFDLYKIFKLDKKYEFSNMTPALFIKDTIKSGILFLIFGSAVIAGLTLIIENFPAWWIYGFVFIFAVIILINALYPLIRDKMYDKFSPLKDEE